MSSDGNAQSLPRDMSWDSAAGALLQAFSPELRALRATDGDPARVASQAVEVVADFTLGPGADPGALFGVELLLSEAGDSVRVGVDLGAGLVRAADAAGPLAGSRATIHLHAIVDHCIVSAIFNNRTAITRGACPKGATSNKVGLYGVDGTTITANWSAWGLRSAVINGTN
jgi:hypothetical protein